MSDHEESAEENQEDQEEDDDEEVEGGGMRAAYSIGDLVNLDDDDDGENPGEDGCCQSETVDTNEHHKTADDDSVNPSDKSVAKHHDKSASEGNLHDNEKGVDALENSADSLLSSVTEKSSSPRDNGGPVDTSNQANEEGEEIYHNAADIRERKRMGSTSPDGHAYANVGSNVMGSDVLEEHSYEAVYDDVAEEKEMQKGGTLVPGNAFNHEETSQGDYENVDHSQLTGRSPLRAEDDGWASSEFEEYEDSEDQKQSQESLGIAGGGGVGGGGITKKVKRFWRKSNPSNSVDLPSPTTNPTMFEKVAARFVQRKRDGDTEAGAEEPCVLEISMNLSKHPPPQLPPPPSNLSSLQLKRRHVVSTVIESEKSYMASLLRLVEDYEKPLLEARPQIVQIKDIRTIFHRIRDILQCHNMFQIELAEVANTWDTEERIGDVFTASFSKSMVFDVYSAFVVNFSSAMETAKKQARKLPAFADFLKQKLDVSEDRLSLFGLMVKPVQRFPQFIMLLQDLLKFTPKEHHERLPLQRALTELEALTDRLNEAKRESESRLEVERLMRNLRGIHYFKISGDCYLVRLDDVIEIKQKNGEPTERPRRLFLLNDQLICTEVVKYETGTTEKFAFQWSVPIRDVELVESNIPSNYTVHIAPGKTLVSAQKSEKAFVPSENNPYKKELDNMIHDLTILQSVLQLTDQLRLKHHEFGSETIRILTRSLQTRIALKCDLEHCLLTLSLPTKALQVSTEKQFKGQVTKQLSKVGRAKSVVDTEINSRVQFTFQFPAFILKHDWLQELQNTKLASDPSHHPAWYTSESDQPSYKNPHFHNPLLLDITKEDSKKFLKTKKKTKDMVQCATYVTLPSPDDLGLGVQHLWVCNGDKTKGQVSIVSLHTNQPCVVESFKVCDSLICCAESVPAPSSANGSGCSANGSGCSASGDSVWMGTEDKKIIICKVLEDNRSAKRITISMDSIVTYLKYLSGKVFAGTRNGTVLIYFSQDGAWNLKQPLKQSLGGAKVSCLLPINQEMWASANLTIHKLSVSVSPNKTKSINKESHELSSDCGQIECMVKAGVGLMIAFSNRAVIRLYHLETLQHLQDINIASAITPLLEGKQLVSPFSEDRKLYSLNITCLLSGHGLLWVGTNCGFILTLPLPRLEGVPQVKRRPAVSFHAHSGPVKFLAMLNCGNMKLMGTSAKQAPSTGSQLLENIENQLTAGNDELGPVRQRDLGAGDDNTLFEDEQLNSTGECAVNQNGVLHPLTRSSQWTSTPELTSFRDSDDDGDVCSLYGSLLKGIDADMDSELIQGPVRRQRNKGANFQHNLNAVSNRVSKISNAVRRNFSSAGHSHQLSSKHQSLIGYLPEDGGPSVNSENLDSSASVAEGSTRDALFQRSSDVDANASQKIEGAVELQANQDGSERNTANETRDEKPPVPPGNDVVSAASATPVRRVLHSKRLVVISGGEGHVNWKEKKPFDKSYEDICLLLWKC